jgi:hypothetical protein
MLMAEPLLRPNKPGHCKDKWAVGVGKGEKRNGSDWIILPFLPSLRFYLVVVRELLHTFITSTWMFHESASVCWQDSSASLTPQKPSRLSTALKGFHCYSEIKQSQFNSAIRLRPINLPCHRGLAVVYTEICGVREEANFCSVNSVYQTNTADVTLPSFLLVPVQLGFYCLVTFNCWMP